MSKNTKSTNPKCLETRLVNVNNETFRLVIPQGVEAKIRFWCAKLSRSEWSGVLFYNTKGTSGEKDFTVKALDFLVMDIGSSVHTQFEESHEIVSYMAENDLTEANIGIIHSHNTMRAYFSGEDEATLLKEGIDRVHFLSLIVNNAGEYVAAMTRRVTSVISVTRDGIPTFGGKTILSKGKSVYRRTVIEAVGADITIEGVRDDSARLDELTRRNVVDGMSVNDKIRMDYPTLFDQYKIRDGGSVGKAVGKSDDDSRAGDTWLTYYYNLILTGDMMCPCDIEVTPSKSLDDMSPAQSDVYDTLVSYVIDNADVDDLKRLVSKLDGINGFKYIDNAVAIISSAIDY